MHIHLKVANHFTLNYIQKLKLLLLPVAFDGLPVRKVTAYITKKMLYARIENESQLNGNSRPSKTLCVDLQCKNREKLTN